MYVPGVTVNISNNTVIFCPPYRQSLALQIGKTGLYALIISLSLIGNTIVILTVYKNQHMRSVTNLFISNLAASDLLITFLGMPNMITQVYLFDKWIFGEAVCKMVVFLQSVSVASSVLTLLVITKDRFVAIIFPFHARMEWNTARIILAVIWVVALGVMAPLIYATRVQSGENGYEICYEDWAPAFDRNNAPKNYTVVLFVTLYLTPLITMAVLYSIIARKLWRRKQVGEQVTNVDPAQTSRKKVIKMLITVVVLFAACWLPLYVYQFIAFFALHRFPCFDYNYIFYFTSLFLSHANSAINPFLYALFNKNYRNGFRVACCYFRGQKEQRARENRRTMHFNSSVVRNSQADIHHHQQNDTNTQKPALTKSQCHSFFSLGNTRSYSPNKPCEKIDGKAKKQNGISGISFAPRTSNSDSFSGSVIMQFSNLCYENDLDDVQ